MSIYINRDCRSYTTTSTCASTTCSSMHYHCSMSPSTEESKHRSLDRGEGNQRGKKWGEEINKEPGGRRERKTHRRLQLALLLADRWQLVAGDRERRPPERGGSLRASVRVRGCCACVGVRDWGGRGCESRLKCFVGWPCPRKCRYVSGPREWASSL